MDILPYKVDFSCLIKKLEDGKKKKKKKKNLEDGESILDYPGEPTATTGFLEENKRRQGSQRGM